MKSLKPATEYDRLWDAGRARQIADWVIGMNESRAATIRMKDLFSIGRVQTAVLALLVDRRKERDNFKPEPYWLVRATFRGEKGTWRGLWIHEGKSRITSRKDAHSIIAAIENRQGVVKSSQRTKKSQPPPLLYSLTDLQQDANIRFAFSAKQTLEDKKTTPPPEYTEALLLKDMTNPGRYVNEANLKKIYRGDVGLGTQATRAQIIETLLARSYVCRQKKTLLATKKSFQPPSSWCAKMVIGKFDSCSIIPAKSHQPGRNRHL